MKKFFVPSGITEDYVYIVPGNGYIDLYNSNYLQPNTTYRYYRIYNDIDSDLYQTLERSTSSYNYGSLNAIQIEPTNSYLYRNDYKDILSVVFIYFIFAIFFINIFTSVIRRGGLLGGLF